MDEAAVLAANYDYEGAIEKLDSFPDIANYPDMSTKRAEYVNAMNSLVEYKDYSQIPNLSFHVLIADPARAFNDKELGGKYNENFVTIDEFSKILDQLYANNYVLVDFDDFVSVGQTVSGTDQFEAKSIFLPQGKKPLMLTETMVNYFEYMVDSNNDGVADAGGAGFANKLVLDENGDIKAQYIDSSNNTLTGNYDFVPILEDFIKAHPDFSYRGARALAHRGIPMIGLPGTIDNDIGCTDYTIGYDTAMNTALEMIDKLRDTTQSHDRCSVVEVMGRNAGYIALNVAIASGAMAVLLPEKEFDMQRDILDKIAETQKTGKRHFIIIVAEGVGHAQEIANEIQARTGIDSRATILGHVQRGGSPTLRDRVNASAMGYQAVCLLEQGKYNRIVGMKGEKLVDYPVDEALEMTKSLDPVLVDVCNTISI